MIEVSNLVKDYQGKQAVAGVSFTLRPGEATGYLGPNGAGKSTTVKMIAGLLQPTAGDIRIAGHDLLLDPLAAKRKLGYVPESAALYTSLTPNEYFSLVAELYQLDQPVAAERIGHLVKAFDLDKLADRQIESLSKGQKQKTLLIGALLHDPEVLLLDEPLNGLDVNAVVSFRRILESMLERGRTILFCSHILEVIERLCKRVIVIDQGRIVADDATKNLLARTREGTLEAVFRSLTKPDDESVQGYLKGLDDAAKR